LHFVEHFYVCISIDRRNLITIKNNKMSMAASGVAIDESQVYCTNASIEKVGRAVAIMLEDAMLPGDERKKHMTVFFRSRGKWTEQEIASMEHEKAAWMVQKYDSAQAPVTFTIGKCGARSSSVLIGGDLRDLCLHLRQAFGSLSKDAQREPHCTVFRKERTRGKKEKKNEKKKDKKWMKGVDKHDKLKLRVRVILERIQRAKAKKEQEVLMLHDEERQLQELCGSADALEYDALKQALKSIAAEFKAKSKAMRGGRHMKHHKHKHMKNKHQHKQQRKQKHKIEKQKDDDKHASKEERRKFKEQKRAEKRLQREQRRAEKEAKRSKMCAARVDFLPSKQEIGGQGDAALIVYVDGYNIIGCDAICRRAMRGKHGGCMSSARQRMAKLIERKFVRKALSQQLSLPYGVVVHLCFDGDGADYKCGALQVSFSSKQQIVDDKLVAMFAQNGKAQNANRLVVTSDKALTLRLYDVGVKVMKSGVFYQLFLAQDDEDVDDVDDDAKNGGMEVDGDDDQKREEDEFVMVMAKKLAQATNDGNGEDTPDDDDDTNDESEGDDDDEDEDDGTDNEYQNEGLNNGINPTDEMENDDENAPDAEYTTIFGEDFDLI